MPGLMEGKGGLVTGAASGLGRACAIRLAREGAAVMVADLESARQGGEETVREIERGGGRAEFFPCDVSRSAGNLALVECSQDASFITGVALPVDAGSVAWVSAHRA
jgi:NAD(P)-dependent dehydrogenase (short-subunit alcohol dehydrogenase family)